MDQMNRVPPTAVAGGSSGRRGVKLTAVQASRFWSLGVAESEMLLDTLQSLGVLTRTTDGHYVLFARPPIG